MPRRLFNLAVITRSIVFLAAVMATEMTGRSAFAASDLLAVTGDIQPGSAAQLLGVSAVTLNEAGQVAFRATLKPGVGPVNATNDRAVWRVDGAARELIAWAGAGGVPGGGNFDQFQAVSIGNAGEVVLRASKTDGGVGFWRYPPSPGSASTLAVTGVVGVPGLPTARWDALGFQLLHAPNNVVAYNGRLESGIGGVASDEDFGAWLDVGGAQSLLVREKHTEPPGVPGAQFQFPTAVAVNGQAQVALFGTMLDEIAGVTSPDSLGIWRMHALGGDLIARRSFGGVAGAPDASFLNLSEPTINGSGQIAFAAELAIGGAVTSANNRGVWLHDSLSGEIVARSGAAAPGIAGASFAAFDTPLLNDGGQLLISASLVEGAGGVTPQNSQGLWIVESGGGILLARTGSAGVPGVPGANFASFGALAFNEFGVAAVQANLTNVAAGTEQGLWLMDGMGDGVLVARTGDVVETRTIATLEFTGGSGGADGRQQALNSSGQLAYKATFTNGDEGLFLYSPDAGADFTFDGSVDGADLLKWKMGFGQTTGAGRADGDADRDGDVDGGDFLLWQQQLSANVPLAAIPEPALAALLLPVGVVGILRLNRGARRSYGPLLLAPSRCHACSSACSLTISTRASAVSTAATTSRELRKPSATINPTSPCFRKSTTAPNARGTIVKWICSPTRSSCRIAPINGMCGCARSGTTATRCSAGSRSWSPRIWT